MWGDCIITRRARGKEGLSIIQYIWTPQTSHLHNGLEFQEAVSSVEISRASPEKELRELSVLPMTPTSCAFLKLFRVQRKSPPRLLSSTSYTAISIMSPRGSSLRAGKSVLLPKGTVHTTYFPILWEGISSEMEKQWEFLTVKTSMGCFQVILLFYIY